MGTTIVMREIGEPSLLCLLDVARLMHELMPAPAPTALDVRALAERLAPEAGVSPDELLVLAEQLA